MTSRKTQSLPQVTRMYKNCMTWIPHSNGQSLPCTHAITPIIRICRNFNSRTARWCGRHEKLEDCRVQQQQGVDAWIDEYCVNLGLYRKDIHLDLRRDEDSVVWSLDMDKSAFADWFKFGRRYRITINTRKGVVYYQPMEFIYHDTGRVLETGVLAPCNDFLQPVFLGVKRGYFVIGFAAL